MYQIERSEAPPLSLEQIQAFCRYTNAWDHFNTLVYKSIQDNKLVIDTSNFTSLQTIILIGLCKDLENLDLDKASRMLSLLNE